MNGTLSISQAEEYLHQLEQLEQGIEYARRELGTRLHQYRVNPTPQARIDLQSSIAYFDKYLLPFALSQQIEETAPTEPSGFLTLGIDGNWGAYEFRQMFNGLDYLNKVYTMRAKLGDRHPDFRIQSGMTRFYVYRDARLHYYLELQEELRVRRIEYASPGLVNVEGLDGIIKEIRETLDYVVTATWLKGFVKNFWEIRGFFNRAEREAEQAKRLAELRAGTAKANAETVEALYRQIQAASRIKRALRRTQESIGQRNEHDEHGFVILDRAGDTIARLDALGLADSIIVEDSFVTAISQLEGLHEKKKITSRVPRERQR